MGAGTARRRPQVYPSLSFPAGAGPFPAGGLVTCPGMERPPLDRIWLKSYPPGIPTEIEVGSGETLVTLLEQACERFGPRPAFTSFGHSITFNDLDRLTRRFAAWLQSLPGVGPGDRVAIMLPNVIQYPVALFGTWRAGMVVVNVNPLYTAPELSHQLADSGAKVLVVVDHRAATFEEIQGETGVRHVLVTGVGDMLGFPKGPFLNFAIKYLRRLGKAWKLPGAWSWRRAMDRSPDAMLAPDPVTCRDLACLQYTGGTTGRAKGAMLSHRNLLANVRQVNAWFSTVQQPGQDLVITPLPLYHVYALTCNCLSYVDAGGNNILITDPRDTKALIAEMRRWPFTAISGVNTLYQSLVMHPDLPSVDFSHLKIVSAGGMAVMESTAKRWVEITGKPILEGYGLSETSPVVTTNPHDIKSWTGTIGLPLPSTDVAILDDEGNPVPTGEPGELCVRGPQVMMGYWNKPEETAKAMTEDGFFRTGDIATMDARGYVRIVDRKKDMIDVSGLKVYPNEVEAAVTAHPDVVEAACIGVPDERTGEAVKLFVVLRTGSTVGDQEIRAFLRERLAPYKIPRHVDIRDSLPKSPVGKILRRELRESAA
jgi:long-chain acyl-CoA synthetase